MYPFGSQHLKNVTDYMKGLKNWRIRIRIRRTVVNLSSNVYIKNVYKSKQCSFSVINIFLDVQPNFYNQMSLSD
ncbi:hypothetical protein DERP_013553 [Dermatophagoides pteronyssinus]|uniref:Uncharacterized protein n=1 Tax=Dermatophagoides pteronyssinus TaxID=6956 RepID=A0ABQ8J5E7_DERPT|nr:hypothetical protein DERP_013553 [Dermatophagoides pteronyssinus]